MDSTENAVVDFCLGLNEILICKLKKNSVNVQCPKFEEKYMEKEIHNSFAYAWN